MLDMKCEIWGVDENIINVGNDQIFIVSIWGEKEGRFPFIYLSQADKIISTA